MRLVRAHLLQWQWSDYAAKHRDRANLWLHVVAVPLFDVATVALIAGVASGAGRAAGLGLAGMVAAARAPTTQMGLFPQPARAGSGSSRPAR
jgi:hypothetical protein